MPSTANQRPAQYRAKAREAREKAAAAPDPETRARLLQDADAWDRMADYDEKNPAAIVPRYYPPAGQ